MEEEASQEVQIICLVTSVWRGINSNGDETSILMFESQRGR